jgi:hypothetical protein
MTTPNKLVPGRIVHYQSYGTPRGEYAPECRPAIVIEVGVWVDVPRSAQATTVDGEVFRTITQVWKDDAVKLNVFNPTGVYFNTCEHSENPKTGGSWHYPHD